MSLGNLKDQGNQGKNFPYQLRNLQLLAGQVTTSQELLLIVQREGWTLIAGNSLDITYFAGVDARNPSGSTTNVDTIEYVDSSGVVLTQEFTYNADDLVTNITAS